MNEDIRRAYPIELQSTFLQNLIYNLDDHLCNQNRRIIELEEELEKAQKIISKRMDDDLNNSMNMMGNVLSAMVSTPSVSSLGPVGATVISKIRDMKNIKQVKTYIEQIVKDNEKELQAMEEDIT